jgi:hypothetical protein
MDRVYDALSGSGQESNESEHQGANPNETNEPATVKAASALSEVIAGRPLDEGAKEIGGDVMHYAFGAVLGAFYGAAAEVRPGTSAGAGIPFGFAVWLAADEIAVPLAGLARKPTDYPLSVHANALASHLAFGLTVEGVRRLLRGRPHATHHAH